MNVPLSLATLESLLETESVGRCALYQASVVSTMDLAREEAEAGAPHGMIVLADRQTRGRGRHGRAWVSPAGGVYVTIILRPGPEGVRSLPIVTPLASCEAIEAVADVRTSIKWPNDVLIEGRKVAGILIETHLSGAGIDYALVGLGVNVDLDPAQHEEIRAIATSLEQESGRKVSRESLVAAFLNRFEKLYAAAVVDDAVYDAWRARLETLGRQVQAQFGDHIEEGVAEDVDAEGNLVLRRSDDSIAIVSAGDVTLTTPSDR